MLLFWYFTAILRTKPALFCATNQFVEIIYINENVMYNKTVIEFGFWVISASYPGAMCCSMACAAFAWAAWINLIDFRFSPSRAVTDDRLYQSQMIDCTIPSVKLVNYGERSFSYAAPKLWNALPEYIRKSETLPIFKTRLKTHLFKHYYD
jgi:hypothetical protein